MGEGVPHSKQITMDDWMLTSSRNSFSKYSAKLEIFWFILFASLVLLAGDVEVNPGPGRLTGRDVL